VIHYRIWNYETNTFLMDLFLEDLKAGLLISETVIWCVLRVCVARFW